MPRLLGVGLASLSLLTAAAAASSLSPAVRLGCAVGFGILTVWSLTSVLLPIVLPRLQVALASVVPRVGVLVGASIGDRPVETGVTVAVWSAVVAAAVGLMTSLGSLGVSMDEFFTGESGPGAVMAFTEDPRQSSPSERLFVDASIVAAIRQTPGVSGAWASRSTTTLYQGVEIPIDDYDVDELVRHGGLKSIADPPEPSVEALRRGEIVASEAFLSNFKLEIGDVIDLATAEGLHSFRIGGKSRSFRGPNGKLALASYEFDRWFRTRGAETVVFWVTGPVGDVLDKVRQATRDRPLFFREGDAMRKQARRVIGRFRALLMVPLMVVGSLGLVGLANLLVGNVAARRRDLSLIRASGGTARNVVAVVALSASLVALAGTAGGMILGFSWAAVIRDAITRFLGWKMALGVDWGLLAGVTLGTLGAASFVSIIPAALTAREHGEPPH